MCCLFSKTIVRIDAEYTLVCFRRMAMLPERVAVREKARQLQRIWRQGHGAKGTDTLFLPGNPTEIFDGLHEALVFSPMLSMNEFAVAD